MAEALENELNTIAMSTYKVVRTFTQRMLLLFLYDICFLALSIVLCAGLKGSQETLSTLIFICYNVILSHFYPSSMFFVPASS